MECDPAFVIEQTTWGSVGGRSAGFEQKIAVAVQDRTAAGAASLKFACMK